MSRYMAIWFRHLLADYQVLRQRELKGQRFILVAPVHGRMVVHAASPEAQRGGVAVGMAVADARALYPSIVVMEAKEGLEKDLLNRLAAWCLRFTPDVCVDGTDGLLLDISGCAHLWGGESAYLRDLILKIRAMGMDARGAIADTVGAAWAVARYGRRTPLVEPGGQKGALWELPAAALRLDSAVKARLHKLGLYRIGSFMEMPRAVLRRRFGEELLVRIDQALGRLSEPVQPLRPAVAYEQRLPCLEPIVTAKGIAIAVNKLLEQMCGRLEKEQRGAREMVLMCFRVDHVTQRVEVATSRPVRNPEHLFKLFELRIPAIRPELGIELFVLEATVTEDLPAAQEALWNVSVADEKKVGELLDKIAGKIGETKIHRFLPAEHYWPERSFKESCDLEQAPRGPWRMEVQRPIYLLPAPRKIDVTAPIPDYPPMLFRYKGRPHRIVKADGPERIEQEWWLEQGQHRDYYSVEDDRGARYWLFRSGHFDQEDSGWFLHGFFA